MALTESCVHFINKVDPTLAKLPLNVYGGLAKLELNSLVKSATAGLQADPCDTSDSF